MGTVARLGSGLSQTSPNGRLRPLVGYDKRESDSFCRLILHSALISGERGEGSFDYPICAHQDELRQSHAKRVGSLAVTKASQTRSEVLRRRLPQTRNAVLVEFVNRSFEVERGVHGRRS